MSNNSLDTEKKKDWLKWAIPCLFFVIGLILPSPFFHKSVKKIRANKDYAVLTDTTNMILKDGVYNGSIIKGTITKHGYGKFETKSGSVYEGEWKNDLLPYGKRTTPYSIYSGQFNEELECHGFGIIEYTPNYIEQKKKNGLADSQILAKYIGNWKKDTKNGLGRAVMTDNSMEFGIFTDGILQKVEGANYRIGGSVYGIDASHHQEDIDWDQLAIYCDKNGTVYKKAPAQTTYMQPVFFAYIKATEGATIKDEKYNIRMIEAERHGITKGAYHLLRLVTSSIDDQLKNFFETVTWAQGDLPPALDIEFENEILNIGTENFYDMTLKWLQEVEKKMGVKPIIYTNEHIRTKYMQDERLNGYDIWISKYSDTPNNFDWQFWQISETGQIRGNKGNIDLNIFKGNYTAFSKFINKK